MAVWFLYLVWIVYFVKSYIYFANLFQQNHYSYKKLLTSSKRFYTKKKYQYYYYWGLLALILSICDNVFIYIAIIFLFLAILYKNHYVIKLKWTKRIIRLSITTFLLTLLPFVLLIKYPLFIYLLVLFLPVMIILASIINYPIEIVIKKYYQNKASKKIAKMENLVKIAITGSFGKTSTKNIIHEVLTSKYLSLKTPKSYNTLMGLAITINKYLNASTEIFVSEMGAFYKGEIATMSKMVKPDIAIITEIGMQHLATFKSIENVKLAKFEIASGQNEKGILVLNYDNPYIASYDKSKLNTKKLYTYGINNGDYHLVNLTYNATYTTFDVYFKDDYLISIKTYLLGAHNALNILATYVTIKALASFDIYISDEAFKKIILTMKPLDHRLSYHMVGKINIYDDSYSSNIVGFKNACDVLAKQRGKKIIITPGIVDGGSFEKKLNEEVAICIKDVFDEIYLIDNLASSHIIDTLTKYNKPYFLFSSFKEAYLTILTKYNESDDFVNLLVENDLPDSFLER